MYNDKCFSYRDQSVSGGDIPVHCMRQGKARQNVCITMYLSVHCRYADRIRAHFLHSSCNNRGTLMKQVAVGPAPHCHSFSDNVNPNKEFLIM